ncbi:ATP-binding cassette sub-family A member 2-like isoform X2 [Dreissena polymorpha]|uniref:ATP-binding cassette sub-family A member 2-like isoform X2 n=1 Tax=Dreissena polymorpha TaxID=45954 RepID=UPI002263C37E|nr:ATP-binding cassette sub-family A member 2-like isoform X2 [Dreissena polymorpha]
MRGLSVTERDTMGFLHQLGLLLWKNFTLKKRSPFVLLFELSIPLVLFVILLSIRRRAIPRPQQTYQWGTQALPSSGIIPIMQTFCEEATQDANHTATSKEESASRFLSNLQRLASQHNFFYPGYTPQEMERLPRIYKNVLDQPITLEKSVKNATDFQLDSVFTSTDRLAHFLHDNLSVPSADVDALLGSTVQVQEVYHLLFGSTAASTKDPHTPKRRSIGDIQDSWPNFETLSNIVNPDNKNQQLSQGTLLLGILSELSPKFKGSLVHSLMQQKALLGDKRVLTLLMQFLSNPSGTPDLTLTPDQVAEVLKVLLLSPDVLKAVSCDSDDLHQVLVTPSNTSDSLMELAAILCNMSDTQAVTLSDILNEGIADEKLVKRFNLQSVNVTSMYTQLEDFLVDLEKFYQFQTYLFDLSILVSGLPQDGCGQLWQDSNITTTLPDPTTMNTTRPTTSMPHDTDKKDKKKPDKFEGFLKFWDGMQMTICGHKPPHRNRDDPQPSDAHRSIKPLNDTDDSQSGKLSSDTDVANSTADSHSLEPEVVVHRQRRSATDDMADFDLPKKEELGLNGGQQHNLKILLHVLYSNPKVLYAPNNSAVETIIHKANETFELVSSVSNYAREWLSISSDLRAYLQQDTTRRNIEAIRLIQKDLRSGKSLLSLLPLSKDPRIVQFLDLNIPEASVFLKEIDSVDNAACTWMTLMSGLNFDVFKGFASEWELVDFFLNEQYKQNVSAVAGLVFENVKENASLPAHIRYKIRQNATFTPTTKLVRNKYWFPGPGSNDYPYYSFGFVWIQDVIERAIINVQVGRDVVEPGSYLIRFPYHCWLYDQFVFMIEHVMPLCLTISWVYSVAMLVQSIVYEKEQRLKEVMKMMGLSNAVHWLAWFLTTFVQFTVTMIGLTAMLKYGQVLIHSDPFLVFTTLELFAIATISFCFLISTLYSKAKVAAACAGIIYFLTYVPYMYVAIKEDVAGDSISSIVKTLVSLFSTTAFGLGGKYFAFYEESGVGVQWSNIHTSPVEGDQYNLLMVHMMMVFDAFLYALLAWYIEAVFPGSYGLPRPWYFPLTRTYWCGGSHRVTEGDCCVGLLRPRGFSVMEEDQCGAMARDPDTSKFEPEPTHLPRGVSIENLTKVYKTGHKLAVKNLSLNLYEGQITSFLGHNGAGKTTTMSILTGLYPPTSGSAVIYGHDIRMDMEVIRQGLGMCPQHNVLFDKLTVEEHLWFYARLKGMKTADINTEMDMMIEDLGLPKKRKSRVDCLSGGMQRKLSVAIAFVGGSRTVILDEPTAGVDPYARRAIWDLLLKYKNARTILLSTHHMDEADLLGDRIAIISNGELKCCGSSLFLKTTFCEGYHLKLVKRETEEDVNSTDGLDQHEPSNNEKVSHCEAQTVSRFIQKYVSTAYLKQETRRELHYILPYEEARKGNFEKLFQALETGQEDIHISSYGVSDSNLEEVFLEVTETAIKDDEDKKSKQMKIFSTNQSASTDIPFEASSPLADSGAAASGSQSDLASHRVLGNAGAGNELELGNISELSAGQSKAPSAGPAMERDITVPSEEEERDARNLEMLSGKGSYVLSNNLLLLNHFRAVIIKRFHYITRNWKGLFSQIILPALFVSIAMTVALSAPKNEDLPPLELSPSMFFNVTQPRGNYIPFSNEHSSERALKYMNDKGPEDLIQTFHLPSGVGATCVLKSPFNSTLDEDALRNLNVSDHTLQLLAHYYEEGCERVFVNGIRLENYVPEAVIISNKDGRLEEIPGSGDIKPTESIPSGQYYPNCICKKDSSGFECSEVSKQPPEFRVVTRDIMQDITVKDGHHNTNEQGKYFLYTTDEYILHRYGAFSFGTELPFVPADFGENNPTVFRQLAVRGTAMAWYNNKGYHAMPVYLNTLNNAILRANLPKHKGHPAAYGITVTNHPMNQTNNVLNMDFILQGADVLIAIFIIAAMSFVPASFVVFLVYERGTKAKHLQFVSGLNPIIYWLANYVWDMCNYVIPAMCIIVILLAFQIPAYISSTNFPSVIALFFLYGWSMTPVMYPASFFFKEPSAAYIFLIVINLFTGITCIICSFLFELFSYDKALERVHVVMQDIFLVFPNYCLGRGLMDIAFNQYKNEFYFKTGQYDQIQSPMRWDLITKKLLLMFIMGLVFFILTLVCEYMSRIRARRHTKYAPNSVDEEDVDVAAERKRVLRGTGRNDLLRLENLTKVYKTRKLGHHLAVDKLCIGVPQGECFGLLGVNGAGKTTTFKMLTGDIGPTSGDAYLNRYSITKDMLKVQQSIGYCPQFDSLFDELTAREHIQLYSRLRGVPPSQENQIVEWALKKLNLTPYQNRPAGTYSGGNKRKLSTAIALIGHPPLIFMDEPTTGMDPHSRRFLWDLIHGLIKDGRSIILTSHSMEECEALCTRLAIMVNGTFKCLGSIQHLKNKFGDGYTLTLRLKGPDLERSQRVARRFIMQNFPEAGIKECHHNLLQFELKDLSLSYVFSKLEEAQKDLNIEDYSVCQNTLDNVFINFVKQQTELVQERHDSTSSLPTSCLRLRPVVLATRRSTADPGDEELLADAFSSDVTIEADDEPLLNLGGTGTRLTLLNMEPVT